MLDLLLKNGIIITVDPEHHIYEHGYLGIEKDKIACIGSMDTDVLPEAKKVIDLEGKPVLPGLVDGHGHAGHGMTKTIAEHTHDWETVAESIYYLYSDEEFWYVEGALSAMERLKFGVTSAVSMVGNTPRIDRIWPIRSHMEGSLSTGIRQYSGIGTANDPWPKRARTYHKDGSYEEYEVTPEEAFRTTEEAVRELNGIHPRGTCIVAPGRMGKRPWCSDEENIRHNQEMYRIARTYHQPIHTHAYGGDVKFLYEHTPEILDYHLSLTHSTRYSEEELDILSRVNAYVFHGPTTHAHIIGRCPVYRMLEKGVHVAVITDGSAPDRSFDLWRDMKNVQISQRTLERDYGVLPCGKVLEMVTIEPAKALGIDHLVGSLEVGKKADIIRVNTWQPHLTPFVKMSVQRLVQYAMGEDVDLVIVDSEIMMEGRTLTKVDEKSILIRANEIFEKVIEETGRKDILENPRLYDIKQ